MSLSNIVYPYYNNPKEAENNLLKIKLGGVWEVQVTINGGCMDITANPRLTDREKVVQVVNLIVADSDQMIVVAAEHNDEFECWFTLSWKKKWYTVEEARDIYTAAKKTVLEKKND